MYFILLTLLLSVMNPPETTDNKSIEAQSKIIFFKPVLNKLVSLGADSTFVYDLVKDERIEFTEDICKINVTGYLKKSNYSNSWNKKAVSQTKTFLLENQEVLAKAEEKYGVPAEIIAALLYIETKHGNYLGNNHIVSVFLSLALVDQPKYVQLNLDNLRSSFTGSEDKLKELEKKIIERTEKKSDWALEQLIALEEMKTKHNIDILNIKGSWAGAFGISQFIPNSYIQWAVDGNDDGIIDLFNMEDAIFSVANYLKTNGWADDKDSIFAALYHYNHSDDYVAAILKLAKKVK